MLGFQSCFPYCLIRSHRALANQSHTLCQRTQENQCPCPHPVWTPQFSCMQWILIQLSLPWFHIAPPPPRSVRAPDPGRNPHTTHGKGGVGGEGAWPLGPTPADLQVEAALGSGPAAPRVPVGSTVQLPCGSEVQGPPLLPSLLPGLPLQLISQFGLLGAREGFVFFLFVLKF